VGAGVHLVLEQPAIDVGVEEGEFPAGGQVRGINGTGLITAFLSDGLRPANDPLRAVRTTWEERRGKRERGN